MNPDDTISARHQAQPRANVNRQGDLIGNRTRRRRFASYVTMRPFMRTRVRTWLRRHYIRQYLARRWPLDTHVVICGFPRSGTTLLHLMVSTTVQAATTFSKERNALGVGGKREARGQPWLITKRPADLLRLAGDSGALRQAGTHARAIYPWPVTLEPSSRPCIKIPSAGTT
jgi:hypothetical protein